MGEELPVAYWVVSAGLLGACIGSFLNVVIWRMPRGESLVSPPSRCPRCEVPIPAWANVPVVSWLLLGGRCRACRERISFRYPAVEAFTALVFALLVWTWGVTPRTGVELVLASALIAVAGIDWDHKIIPNEITYTGLLLGLVCAWWVPPPLPDPYFLPVKACGFLGNAVTGALVGYGLLWGVAAFYERFRGQIGLGMGDVKLVGMLGAFLGLERVLGVVVLGSLIGLVYGIAYIAATGGTRQTRIPFGPALALAGLVELVWPLAMARTLASLTERLS